MLRRLREIWRRWQNPTLLQTWLKQLRSQTARNEIEWERNIVTAGIFAGVTMSYRWQNVELLTIMHFTEGTHYLLRVDGEACKLDFWERQAARRLFRAIGGF